MVLCDYVSCTIIFSLGILKSVMLLSESEPHLTDCTFSLNALVSLPLTAGQRLVLYKDYQERKGKGLERRKKTGWSDYLCVVKVR